MKQANDSENGKLSSKNALNSDTLMKEDHRSLNHKVSQYIHNIQQYAPEEYSALDLASLNGEFPIDPTLDASTEERSLEDRYQKKGIDTINSLITPEEEQTLLPVPPGIDPKSMCRFCGKTFAHPGSLGRHLDDRKGIPPHTASIISKIRAKVSRRGNNAAIRARRKQKAHEYNQRDYVKAKNRKRRRVTGKVSRVKEASQLKFYRALNTPKLDEDETFPGLVLFFLPTALWPVDLPNSDTLNSLLLYANKSSFYPRNLEWIEPRMKQSTFQNKCKEAYQEWCKFDTNKQYRIWYMNLRKCAERSLGSLTLYDLAVREKFCEDLAHKKKQQLIEEANEETDKNNTQSLNPDELAAVAVAAAEAAVKRGFK